ncbi:hypothetical protein [uncultured Croceitalea sp.]|uniref:hypothetical protein n=1 Tax=uncultured Croceitalea sp. TaxID=1798908 RepID=UPI003305F123
MKIHPTFVLILFLVQVHAQNNTFPTSGNVGIGTTNPLSKLTVKGHVNIGDDGNYRLRTRHVDGKNLTDRNVGSLYLNYNTGQKVLIGWGNTAPASDLVLAGRLGIGTTSPIHHIDVINQHQATESFLRFRVKDAPNDYFQIANTTGAAGQFIPLIKGHRTSDNRYSISVMGSTADTNDTGSNAVVNFDARRTASPIQNRPLFVWTSYTDKKMTMLANGNLGIGTTSPSEKLEIEATNPTHAIFKGSHTGIQGIQVERSGGDHIRLVTNYTGYGGGLESSSKLRFAVNGNTLDTPSMMLNESGNLGIGTTNPGTYKLAVRGKIRAEEIKVETGWADYVFQEDYNLPTLDQVENHIKTKGHLINIPSAKEVAENGVQLGEMNKLLLEKIEELTLYLIDMKKENQNQQEQLIKMKEELSFLKKSIKNE